MMGGWKEFRLGVETLVGLLCAFTVVMAGLVLYGALGLTALLRAGEAIFGAEAFRPETHRLGGQLLRDLLRSPLLLGLALLPGAAVLGILRIRRGPGMPRLPRESRPGRVLSSAVALLLAGWTVLSGGSCCSMSRALVGGATELEMNPTELPKAPPPVGIRWKPAGFFSMSIKT